MRKEDSKGRILCNTCTAWLAKKLFKQFTVYRTTKSYQYYQGDCIECWTLKNRQRVKAWVKRNRQLVTTKALDKRAELRKEFITAYGGKCACCSEKRFEFLTLDHPHGRTGKKVPAYIEYAKLKRAKWPKALAQILCFNCNSAKGVYGSCPHTWKRGERHKPLTYSERIALYANTRQHSCAFPKPSKNLRQDQNTLTKS